MAGRAKDVVALTAACQELRIDRWRFCDPARAVEIALRHDTFRQRLRLGAVRKQRRPARRCHSGSAASSNDRRMQQAAATNRQARARRIMAGGPPSPPLRPPLPEHGADRDALRRSVLRRRAERNGPASRARTRVCRTADGAGAAGRRTTGTRSTPHSAAANTPTSNGTSRNTCQELSGRPPLLSG